MKKISLIFFLFLVSCVRETNLYDVKPTDNIDDILNMSSNNIRNSDTIQKTVDKQTTKVIIKTIQSISKLNEKNVDLKHELNDANKKIDTITNVNVGVKFNLLPISDIKENR